MSKTVVQKANLRIKRLNITIAIELDHVIDVFFSLDLFHLLHSFQINKHVKVGVVIPKHSILFVAVFIAHHQ